MAYPTSSSVLGVSIAFDDTPFELSPTWTRIDQDAVVTSWKIDRGRTSELDKTGTGTATVSIVDKAGTFDPTNTGGTFYGKLDPMKQAAIALYNPTASTWTTVFRGFVSEWLFDLDVSERFFNVTIELVDAMDVLSRLQLQPGDGVGTVPAVSVSDVYYEGQPTTEKHVDDRITDVLNNVGFPFALQDIFSGNVEVQEKVYDRGDSALSVIADAVDAEFPAAANFYISKDGYAVFHGRYARFFPDTPGYGITTWHAGDQTACSDTTYAPVAPLSFRRSEADIINAVLALPLGVDPTDVPAALVLDGTSYATYGYRAENFEDLLVYSGHDDDGATTTALTETGLIASYFVSNYKDPKTRLEDISFRPRPAGTANASAWWGLVCGVDVSDIIHLKTTHPGGGGFNEDFYVEGLHYEADTQGGAAFTNVTLRCDVSPKSFYATNPFGSVDGSLPTPFVGMTMTVVATGSTA